jgi:hypothetical protein
MLLGAWTSLLSYFADDEAVTMPKGQQAKAARQAKKHPNKKLPWAKATDIVGNGKFYKHTQLPTFKEKIRTLEDDLLEKREERKRFVELGKQSSPSNPLHSDTSTRVRNLDQVIAIGNELVKLTKDARDAYDVAIHCYARFHDAVYQEVANNNNKAIFEEEYDHLWDRYEAAKAACPDDEAGVAGKFPNANI